MLLRWWAHAYNQHPLAMAIIEQLRFEHIALCEKVLRQLPAWFGIEQAIRNYASDLERCDGLVATVDGTVVAFVGLKRYGSHSIELNVIGVLPEYRRKGMGSQLIEAVENLASESGVQFLHTKTLSASVPYEPYEQTRKFWRAMGFLPLDEHLLWGSSNPCLVLIKALR